MGIIAAIKSVPVVIATIIIVALAIAFGVERHAKTAAEAKLDAANVQLGAAQASLGQWKGAAESCSSATTVLAAKLATTQASLDEIAAQKVKVVIQREVIGRQQVASADSSKSCAQALADFIASYQAPANLQTSAKMGDAR